jgi:hypothetical protein
MRYAVATFLTTWGLSIRQRGTAAEHDVDRRRYHSQRHPSRFAAQIYREENCRRTPAYVRSRFNLNADVDRFEFIQFEASLRAGCVTPVIAAENY